MKRCNSFIERKQLEDAFQCRQMKKVEQWYKTESVKISKTGNISSGEMERERKALDIECHSRRCRLMKWRRLMLADGSNPIYCRDRRGYDEKADNLTHNERVLLMLYLKSHWNPGRKNPHLFIHKKLAEQSQIESMDRLMNLYGNRVITVYTAELEKRLIEKREYYNNVDSSWCDDDLSINDFTGHDILSLIGEVCSNQFVKLLAMYMLGQIEPPLDAEYEKQKLKTIELNKLKSEARAILGLR